MFERDSIKVVKESPSPFSPYWQVYVDHGCGSGAQ